MANAAYDARARRASGARLAFSDSRVVKYQDPYRARLELVKTRLGEAVGRATSLFTVPRIISHDVHSGVLTFEYLTGLRSLRDVLATSPRREMLVERLGYALAAIHSDLSLPADVAVPVPDLGVARKSPHVCLHGDYWIGNMLYDDDQDMLVILDWSTASWLGERVTTGPCHVDVSTLVLSLFNQRILAPQKMPDRRQLARVFLDGYSAASSNPFTSDSLKSHFPRILSKYIPWNRAEYGMLRSLAYRSSLASARVFVRGLR